MIVVQNLTRHYGTLKAVDNVSFTVGEGEIVGLLGHNGAGKTTIMKMLTGFLEPSAGSITIDGHNVETTRRQAQARIGYLPENCPIYLEMTVVDFLDYAASLHGVAPEQRGKVLREAIAATALEEKADSLISNLSRGYRQRVGVAQAILHKPKIVILDEPTNGLDPSQIRHMRDLVKELAKTATVILSTHILQEVQAVCDRVIIIDHGKLVLDAKLADLRCTGDLRLVTPGTPDVVEPLVRTLDQIKGIDILPDQGDAHVYGLRLDGQAVETIAPEVARAIHEKGLDLVALYPEQRDLETVFAESAALNEREVEHA
jgi:ABC-2 type transport system ATP-binding protein